MHKSQSEISEKRKGEEREEEGRGEKKGGKKWKDNAVSRQQDAYCFTEVC